MSADAGPRRLRADAERSTARILAAAEEVLAVDANATLERIADAAGSRAPPSTAGSRPARRCWRR